MSQITFTIPNVQLQRVLNGVSDYGNYQATIPDPTNPAKTISNPETKASFAKRIIIEEIKHMVTSGERKKAEATIIIDQTELDIT